MIVKIGQNCLSEQKEASLKTELNLSGIQQFEVFLIQSNSANFDDLLEQSKDPKILNYLNNSNGSNAQGLHFVD
jgi:hypothetical protein